MALLLWMIEVVATWLKISNKIFEFVLKITLWLFTTTLLINSCYKWKLSLTTERKSVVTINKPRDKSYWFLEKRGNEFEIPAKDTAGPRMRTMRSVLMRLIVEIARAHRLMSPPSPLVGALWCSIVYRSSVNVSRSLSLNGEILIFIDSCFAEFL